MTRIPYDDLIAAILARLPPPRLQTPKRKPQTEDTRWLDISQT